MRTEETRPDPEALLREIEMDNSRKKQESGRGHLKIFFGYCAGVGKTYAMLDEARQRYYDGVDVVLGYIEPHTRPETTALTAGIPSIPPRVIDYKGITLRDFDVDAALRRHPQLILVDEFAHSNPEGARNRKRYQDIEELLNAGIDVYTTVNVQHIESMHDVVSAITGISVRERIPDAVFDMADKIRLVDIDPEELLDRFSKGRVYARDKVDLAKQKFFTLENLNALREISLRRTAERIVSTDKKRLIPYSKMLVCVGPAPSSAHCIRTACRLAEAFSIPWVALYVKTSRYLDLNDRKTLQSNMDLAEQMGAEIVVLKGDDVPMVISEYIHQAGVSNVVVGKSGTARSSYFKKDDLEDLLLSACPGIELHIVPDRPNTRRHAGKSEQGFRTTFRRRHSEVNISRMDMLKVLLLLALATILSIDLKDMGLMDENALMLFILATLLTARVTTGYLYSMIAATMGMLLYIFFFVEPLYTLHAKDVTYIINFLILITVALLSSAMTNGVMTQARMAIKNERRTEILYDISKQLLANRGLDRIVTITNAFLVKEFQRGVIFYTQPPDTAYRGKLLKAREEEDCDFMTTVEERAVVQWVFKNKKQAGNGTDTLSGSLGYYMPVISQGKVLGVIGMSCKESPLPAKRRSFLRMIISQVAMALERQRLSDAQSIMQVETEREKMRSNFLRAISHDLRTPLTGIMGSSQTLLDNLGTLDMATEKKLLNAIRNDSEWIIRMVENLLSITRIGEGRVDLKKTPEIVEEIVGGAVAVIQKRFEAARIQVEVPGEMLFVPMDATLVEQVLINLMENAIKHAGGQPEITLSVVRGEKTACFTVSDKGRGLSEEQLAHLFDGRMTDDSHSPDSQRGMGIGLSICKTIVDAHDGTIRAYNRPEGGAAFVFELPLEEDE